MTAARALQVEAVPPLSHADDMASVSRNLNGQRLGRKGRVTRERIIAAAADLISQGEGSTISLSAVARNASLGMTSVYLYFNDLTEVLLAVLEPVMAEAEQAFLERLRSRWPDEALAEHCLGFVRGYHEFWERNAPILHLRNRLADAHDLRMLSHRIEATQPVIGLLAEQMAVNPADEDAAASAMASMLMTGIERAATVATDDVFSGHLAPEGMPVRPARFLMPAARLLELAIRDHRTSAQ